MACPASDVSRIPDISGNKLRRNANHPRNHHRAYPTRIMPCLCALRSSFGRYPRLMTPFSRNNGDSIIIKGIFSGTLGTDVSRAGFDLF
ncbi:hypothetical protein TcasGA2_TC002513 [Tribolium castaneum]|uniref:Uncharacterized protein n=1 Tax=Tribolium castaneum TaxID=7070 RepID=D6WH72_TRICA|nr:hypothetical protein TcasGA2_TC002513 [Tribolium castaneum]